MGVNRDLFSSLDKSSSPELETDNLSLFNATMDPLFNAKFNVSKGDNAKDTKPTPAPKSCSPPENPGLAPGAEVPILVSTS